MSGHKRATVALSQDDFRRLHEAEQRLRSVEQDYHAIRSRVQSLHTAELERSLGQLCERQQRFQSALQGVDDDLAALEAATSQALLEHFSQVEDRVTDQVTDQVDDQLGAWSEQLLSGAADLVDASALRLEGGLEQLAAQHQDDLDRLQRSLRKLHRSQKERAELAAHSLASAQALLEALQSTYDLPPEARPLAHDLQNARTSFEHGLFEAALAGAQATVTRLADLRLRLEQALAHRDRLQAGLRLQARRLYEAGRQSRQVPALDLDGNPLDFAVDLPFWSDGAFQDWLARTQHLLRQLETPLEAPELEQIQQQRLPELEQALSEAIYQARLNVIASQVRFNIAACIVQALQEQGFELADAEYDAADLRAAYQATVRAFDGSEVVVHVNPVPGDPAATDVDLVSHDRQPRSEHELRARARELALSLQASGLQVGRLSVPLHAPAVGERRAEYRPSGQPLPVGSPAPAPARRPRLARKTLLHPR